MWVWHGQDSRVYMWVWHDQDSRVYSRGFGTDRITGNTYVGFAWTG